MNILQIVIGILALLVLFFFIQVANYMAHPEKRPSVKRALKEQAKNSQNNPE